MIWVVTYSRAGRRARRIGRYDSLWDAFTAAGRAGAIGEDSQAEELAQGRRRLARLRVRGREYDHIYVARLERGR